jgi:thiol-disulfide isomerase/thioredoxin
MDPINRSHHTLRTPCTLMAVPALVLALTAGSVLAQETRDPPSGPAEHTSNPGGRPPTITGAGVDEAAVTRLRQAADAIAQAQTLSFRLHTAATGMLANGTPIVDFGIRMVRTASTPNPWLVRIDGEGKRRPAEAPQEVTATFDDMIITWVDHEAKLLHSKAARSARGQTYQLIYAARITEIMGAQPLARELSPMEAVLEAPVEFDGVTCDVISIKTRSGNSRIRWWIGQNDNLPRKVEKLVESATAGGSSTTEFIQMRAGESFTEKDLEVQLPEGYARGETDSPRAINPPTPRPQPNAQTPQPIDENTEPVPTQPQAQVPESRPPEPPARLPVELTLTESDGTKVELASMRGKPVVLVFMATWSLPSRNLLEDAEQLKVSIGEQIPVLALAVRERYPEQVTPFVRDRKASLRIFPRSDDAAKELGIEVLPAVVILDSTGTVAHTIQGITKGNFADVWSHVAQLGGPPAPARAEPQAKASETEPAPEGAGR